MSDASGPSERHRTRRRLETGWRFHRGDVADGEAPGRDASDWEPVEVPHDWSIEGPWDPANPGDQQQGFAPGGVGWYRRDLPERSAGATTYLRFEGVYRDSDVYLDGERVGGRPGGYASFHCGISDRREAGGETLAVRVDNDEYPHCRWYTGSGIYRDVHLIETAPLHVLPWGTDVRVQGVTDRRADATIRIEVANRGDAATEYDLLTEVYDPEGDLVTTVETRESIGAGEEREVRQGFAIDDPRRWSLDDPVRYRARTVLHRDGDPVDDYVTPFGVRTFEWTADAGFFLNGDPVTLKGVNLHHDAGCLGAAVPERALERRLETLQAMGCNAVRTAHNPPRPALLDLCDEMGMLVIDEAFDKWRHEGSGEYFEEWWREDLEAMIRRDRNHPSVVCWSVGNESYDQGEESMLADLERLAGATNDLDPTRPVTYGNPPWGEGREGVIENIERVAEHVDVLSCNYQEHLYEDYREAGIDLPIVGSECRPFFRGAGDDPLAYVPRNPWLDVADREDVAGQFVWAGVDYLGESREWPSRGWAAGLLDTCGEPKPEAAYHRAAWSEEPVVRLAAFDPDRDRPAARPNWSWPPLSAHWNFPDQADSRGFVHVFAFTNAETIELIQNDEWLGEQSAADGTTEWYVPYDPGTLRAVAREDGEVVDTHELRTAGEPARIELDADRGALDADGRDLAYVTARIVDEDGVTVPRATHEVDFDVTGAGDLAGVDNGNLDSTEPYVGASRSAYHGTCLAVVQASRSPGEVDIGASAPGLSGDRVTLSVTSPE